MICKMWKKHSEHPGALLGAKNLNARQTFGHQNTSEDERMVLYLSAPSDVHNENSYLIRPGTYAAAAQTFDFCDYRAIV